MMLQEIEKLLTDSCNGTKVELPCTFKNMYASDLKMDSLVAQLSMLPDLLRTANSEHKMGIKKVTSVNTICDLFSTCSFADYDGRSTSIASYIPVISCMEPEERAESDLRRPQIPKFLGGGHVPTNLLPSKFFAHASAPLNSTIFRRHWISMYRI